MSARATTIAQGFSARMMQVTYDKEILPFIVNRDYEGEINDVGSKLNILDFDKISEKDYNNVALSADSITENNGALVIDKYKSFYWKQKDLDNWLSYIKNPKPKIINQTAGERARNKELYVLAKYAQVGAGNRVGTDYTTGTVTIDAAGNVTGSGTTFTAGMVGRGFKATGHSKWYRVKTFSSTTAIVIEDDLDDIASAYTGGVINAGATFTIEAVTALSITTTNLLQYFAALKLKLDKAEANGFYAVPDEDRYVVVPPEFNSIIVRANGVALHVPEVFSNLVRKGFSGMFQGFMVFVSNRLTGDNTNGYHTLAGHTGWQTFADKVVRAQIEEDLPGDFGTAFKDLYVYGSKVKDAHRHMAAEGFFTFSV